MFIKFEYGFNKRQKTPLPVFDLLNEGGIKNINNNPWEYLKTETNLYLELNLYQNILVNVSSAEALDKNGLMLGQLAEKLNKANQSKPLLRGLDKLVKDYNVQ